MRALVAAALALALSLAPAVPAASQCAMCGTALTGSPEGRAMSAQFNRAILMMLFAPYVVVGALAGVLFHRQIASHLSRLTRRWPLPRRFRPAR